MESDRIQITNFKVDQIRISDCSVNYKRMLYGILKGIGNSPGVSSPKITLCPFRQELSFLAGVLFYFLLEVEELDIDPN